MSAHGAMAIAIGCVAIGCAAPSARGLDGSYHVSGTIAVFSGPSARISDVSGIRLSSSTVEDADFDLQLSGSVDCTLSGRWIEAGSDYFEPVRRAACAINAIDGISSVVIENDHGGPSAGSITANGDRNVWITLNGNCHLTDGSTRSCTIDLNGAR